MLSAEEEQWLRENYKKISQNKIAKHLMISSNTVREIAKRMGIFDGNKFVYSAAKVEITTMVELGDGYCLDCGNYRNGGICERDGRLIGALHKKSCFTKKS